MTSTYTETSSSVLGVAEVLPKDVSSYGIVKTSTNSNGYQQVEKIVEKPSIGFAPSNLAVIGRYILTPRIFTKLSQIQKGVGGEIQLTDAISSLLDDEVVFTKEILGTRYDCGSKIGYLKATVAFGLKHPETSKEFRNFIGKISI